MMKNVHLYPDVFNALNARINLVKWLMLLLIFFAAVPLQTSAFTLDVKVADGMGGRVAGVPGDIDCATYCTIQASSQTLVSLFALPDKGYRFQRWYGACANTIGPLCTLKPGENVSLSALFVKNKLPQVPTKALLLLHDEGVRHTVWNEFIKQHFNNRCPVIYGGVVLGEDSFDLRNNVYCYRIAFGYYDMLNHSEAAIGLQQLGGDQKAKNRFSGKRLGHEVRAAVLGVLNRHPDLSLTLVGQGRAELAAQSFLQTDTAERSEVIGLLALDQSSYNKKDATSYQPRQVAVQTGSTAILKLEAKPEQDGKISDALVQLTKAWWMTR